jgi:hypothetical protein
MTSPLSAPPRTAADICGAFRLGPRARALLGPQLAPGDYLKRLIDGRLYVDAIRLMAHALRRREAVWWACLCTQHAGGGELPPAEGAALKAAVRWVLGPSEERRQAAKKAAAAAGLKTPAGCAAQAAFLADPSSPTRSAKLVGVGVLLAAARRPAAERTWTYRQFVAVGLDVEAGTATWAPPGARQPSKGTL